MEIPCSPSPRRYRQGEFPHLGFRTTLLLNACVLPLPSLPDAVLLPWGADHEVLIGVPGVAVVNASILCPLARVHFSVRAEADDSWFCKPSAEKIPGSVRLLLQVAFLKAVSILWLSARSHAGQRRQAGMWGGGGGEWRAVGTAPATKTCRLHCPEPSRGLNMVPASRPPNLQQAPGLWNRWQGNQLSGAPPHGGRTGGSRREASTGRP